GRRTDKSAGRLPARIADKTGCTCPRNWRCMPASMQSLISISDGIGERSSHPVPTVDLFAEYTCVTCGRIEGHQPDRCRDGIYSVRSNAIRLTLFRLQKEKPYVRPEPAP